jgi:hypothetical protein
MAYPTPNKVVNAWLTGLPNSARYEVADSLPNSLTGWKKNFYIVADVISSPADAYVPIKTPIYQLTVYGKGATSNTLPPWNAVNEIAQDLEYLCYGAFARGTLSFGSGYSDVRLTDVSLLSSATKQLSDIQNLAKFSLDISMTYMPSGLVTIY